MSDIDYWVIEIKGPKGVKQVSVPDNLIQFLAKSADLDPYVVAADTASTHFRMASEA